MVERYYGHLDPRNLSDDIQEPPRFPELFPAAAEPMEVGRPRATGGSPKTRKSGISDETPLSASENLGEGRRTRTFNQRIKSPMLYH